MQESSHRFRSDAVKFLGFGLGNGSAVVFEKHADVMSQLISSLGVNLTFRRVADAVFEKNKPCLFVS